MGWWGDWVETQRARIRIKAELAVTKLRLDDVVLERDHLAERMRGLEAEAAHRQRKYTDIEERNEELRHQVAMLGRMLEDTYARVSDVQRLRDANLRLERHNAVFETSVQWAIGHINLVTVERAALIDRLVMGAPTSFPSANLAWQPAETPEPPPPARDVPMAPPPGPIAADGGILGTPIPDGRTAGDVIAALRERRERDRQQAQEISGDEALRRAAELFEDTDGRPENDQAPPAIDPFTDIP